MNKMTNVTARTQTVVVLGGVVLIALVVAYVAGPSFGFGRDWDRDNWPVRFQSNGERISSSSSKARHAIPVRRLTDSKCQV